MKTILLLTDLSKKAENAALYALKVAEKMNAGITLFHSLNVTSALVSGEFENPRELRDLKENLEKQRGPGRDKPVINMLTGCGNLGRNVNNLVLDKNIALIVMGAKSDDIISQFIFGSETNSVLDETRCPILFVPAGCVYKKMQTIVFFNDLKKAYHDAVDFLTQIARINNSEIIVSHIKGNEIHSPEPCLFLFKNINGYSRVKFMQIPGEDVEEKLMEFIASVNADLIVMIHHQHLLFGKIIPGSNSKNMLYHHALPLLILPD